MVVKPFRRFMLRFFNFAFFIIISGNSFSAIDSVSYRSELFHCPSEGFHPDPEDCKIFYRCVDWNTNSFRKSSDSSLTAFRFTCADGTVFDPDLNVCNHPQDTSRTECGGSRVPLSNQYPFMHFSLKDNTGGYLNGGPFLPTNESSFPSRQFQNGNAYADEYSYGQEDNNKYPWQIDEYEDPVRDAVKISGNCQSEGFFAIEGDCTKFMRCIIDGMGRYTMYTFQCGPGTVWDQKNLICNYPYAVPGCGGTEGYNGQVLMSSESDYNYDSVWMQPGRENKKGYNGESAYSGMPVRETYPDVENQEGRPPIGDYSELGNYPYHGDHRIYPQQHIQTYSTESTKQEWNANNFQQTNYPVINPVQTHNGNIPYHATYSEAQFQGKYSQAAYYFTGENFGHHPGQNVYQYGPEPWAYGQVPYIPTQNRTNQIVIHKRPNQLSHSEQGKQNNHSKYRNQESYTGYSGYQNRPRTPATVQMLQHATQNRTSQISPMHKHRQPSDQQNKEYTSQVYENNYPNHKHSSEESEVPSGDAKECHKDGFFNIPKECKRFFRCVDNGKGGYFRYDFNCGEGTVWDQESTTCNYPWAVKRNDVDCSSEGSASESSPNSFYSTSTYPTVTRDNETWIQTSSLTTLSHSTNFHTTVSSTKDHEKASQSQNQESHHYKPTTVEQETSSYTTLNKEISHHKETTDKHGTTTPMTPHEYHVTDKNRTPEIQYENENNTHNEKFNNGDDETSTSLSGTTPFKPNKKDTVKCQKAGFYPYPGSCKKFYRCIDWDGDKGERFSVYYFECGPGTIWDPALETCNHEDSVYPSRDCQEKSQENMEEKGPSSTDKNTSVTDESTELTITSDYTTTTYSDNKTSQVHTTSNDIETTIYTSEENEPTTNSEGFSFGSTNTGEPEMSTVSSFEETSSTVETTDSTMTTVYDNTITTENPISSTTLMTTTDHYDTLYTTNHQTDTTYTSTHETMFTSGQTTEIMYPSDISTTTEPVFTDAEQEVNPTTENSSEQNHTTEENSPDCPVLEEDQISYVCPTGFRRHPRECNNFYQCTINKEGDVNIMILSCQNNTVYDEKKIQCLPQDETESCPSKTSGRSRYYRRTETEKISMVPVSSSYSLCPNQGNFPYHGDCQKFFKCRTDRKGKMQGFLYQCPENFSFWEVSKKCELSIKLPKCSRLPQDVSTNKLRWMSSKVPVSSLGSEVR